MVPLNRRFFRGERNCRGPGGVISHGDTRSPTSAEEHCRTGESKSGGPLLGDTLRWQAGESHTDYTVLSLLQVHLSEFSGMTAGIDAYG